MRMVKSAGLLERPIDELHAAAHQLATAGDKLAVRSPMRRAKHDRATPECTCRVRSCKAVLLASADHWRRGASRRRLVESVTRLPHSSVAPVMCDKHLKILFSCVASPSCQSELDLTANVVVCGSPNPHVSDVLLGGLLP
ncbi:hypothetical protein GCM10007977_046710 [Dactylosporangium sucinum]|uniref:Uncharacterized protein n=1 Tax=Dactylosporangium sucinum TaxID=1424081 RepID=A0A917WXR1_9ACTN|nr:hypothetical protein GCM10007977_046710 [Dactylosporangium sucinum]